MTDAETIEILEERLLDAESILDAWFDRRELGHKAVDAAVIGCVEGYLRTSRCGGMPSTDSDIVSCVIEDMTRLGIFADLFARAALNPAHGDYAWSIVDEARKAITLEKENKRLSMVLERDRTNIARFITDTREVIRGRSWLTEAGRGSHDYDDEEYQEEFADAINAIEEQLDKLGEIARDWSDCPTDPDEISAARKSKKK